MNWICEAASMHHSLAAANVGHAGGECASAGGALEGVTKRMLKPRRLVSLRRAVAAAVLETTQSSTAPGLRPVECSAVIAAKR